MFSCAVVVQQVGFVGLQLYSEGSSFQVNHIIIIMSIILRHALLFRVANDTPIAKAEQDQELVNQAADPGYLVFSGASDCVEKPEFAQGEGKPRMHNLTLMF